MNETIKVASCCMFTAMASICFVSGMALLSSGKKGLYLWIA